MKYLTVALISSAFWIGFHLLPQTKIDWISLVFPLLWLIVVSFNCDSLKKERRK